jgi:hypothetical protein
MHNNSTSNPQPWWTRQSDGIKIAIISGIFAVIAAIVTGIFTLTSRNPAGGTQAMPPSIVDSSSSPNGPGQRTPSTSQSPTPSAVTTTAVPGIRNQGSLTLTPSGGGADLDSADKNWGSSGNDCQLWDIELYSAGQNTGFWGTCGLPGKFATVPSKSSTSYSACADATGYMEQLPGSEIHAGIQFCVHTSEGRYVLIKVVNCDPKTGDNGLNRVDLYVVSWDTQSS